MTLFTIFNPAGDTIQSAPSLSDLLVDVAVQADCQDPTRCMALVEDGHNKRVMTLEKAVNDYIDHTQRSAQVAAMHQESASITAAANWLESLPAPAQPLPEEPEPETALEPSPVISKSATRGR